MLLRSPRFIARAASVALASVTMPSLLAQVTVANYPLLMDLNDSTGAYGPVALGGSATGPSNGVCVDGVYVLAGGSDAETPNISGLNENDFQIELDFQVATLAIPEAPILMGGDGWRWIGFYVDSAGNLGVAYNNSMRAYSSTPITVGTWHFGEIKYEGGTVELFLDGVMILQSNIGPLSTGNNLNFTTNDYAWGRNHDGCIRNLVISNDTTLGSSSGGIGTNYCGPANPNSTGVPGAISATGFESITANNVTLRASDLPTNSFGFFITSRTQGLAMNPSGSAGNLCLGGSIGRYVGPGEIQNSGMLQEFSLALDLTMVPQPNGFVSVVAGETWSFQAWHRDSVGGMATSNFTDGIEITFQ